MDDKIFNLMEKMYLEMQEMKSNMATKKDLTSMATKKDLTNMATKEDLSKIQKKLVIIENRMEKNHAALYDGYKLNYEKLNILETKVNEIDKKVDKQDVEIRVIKGAK